MLCKAPICSSSLQVLAPEDWQRWHATYTRAASSLEEREGRIASVAEQLEQGLELLGVTAIEDKLQVELPRAGFGTRVQGCLLRGTAIEHQLQVGSWNLMLLGSERRTGCRAGALSLPGHSHLSVYQGNHQCSILSSASLPRCFERHFVAFEGSHLPTPAC